MNPQQPQASSPQPMQPLPAQTSPQGMPVQPNPTQSANQSKANLGLVNTMQEQLLHYKSKQQGTHPSQKPENQPQSTQTPEMTKDPQEEKKDEKQLDMTETLTSFKKEIEGMLDSRFGDIQRELQTLLSEEKDEPDETKTETPTVA